MPITSRAHRAHSALITAFALICIHSFAGCMPPRNQPQPAPNNNQPQQPYGSPAPRPAQPPAGPAPAAGSPEAIVQMAVQVALQNDFQGYLSLIHSEEKQNQKQVAGIEAYSWKRFTSMAKRYLDAGGHIQVARTNQEGPDLMLYIRDQTDNTRMPPPMRLRPDPAAQNAWRIVSNSL